MGYPTGGWQQLALIAEASRCCGRDNDVGFINGNYLKFSGVCPKPLQVSGKLSVSGDGG